MSSVCGDEGFPSHFDDQGSSAHEEKIFVSIRVRPLNDREISRNDVADWECINNTTILFKNNVAAYQFDRVFGFECSTREVYDEAAKRVVLSVLSGINSSIFAYGQTSSGKTYTMSGITTYAIQDIYDYINKHTERKFVLKFSAIEIYNEVVRDLLSSDNAPLRLLDDPERGTVVERLSEVTLRDQSHLIELLSVCEAQRQIGETSLNGMSSRSHQILRLTVESSAKQYLRAQNNSTLSAAVNFIDLAGSERASQTLSAGTRLKEGCHINRSLLTLGTVIRKLSKGRNGHVPYRDSKLTRILQNSLGGNARTAIICTMSPAHSHVEQSRNTLLFATCAKQVATKAQVNVVMSDKALVKQLQRELARLESELKALKLRSADENSALALKEKEEVIEKMEKEMRELMTQRDTAQSRIQNLLRSRPWAEMSNASETPEHTPSESTTPFRMDIASRLPSFSDRFEAVAEASDDRFLSEESSPRLFINEYFGPDPSKDFQIHESNSSSADSCREVECVETDSSTRNVDFNDRDSGYNVDFERAGQSPFSSDTDTSYSSRTLRRRSFIATPPTKQDIGEFSGRSMDCNDKIAIAIAHYKSASDISNVSSTAESLNPDNDENLDFEEREFKLSNNDVTVREAEIDTVPNEDVDDVVANQICYKNEVINTGNDESSDVVEEHKPEISMDKPEISMDDATACQVAFGSTTNEDPNLPKKQLFDNLLLEAEQKPKPFAEVDNVGPVTEPDQQRSQPEWSEEFERQRREIIELWNVCHVPLVHRTYFFLLFKGDPTDAVYMEVELRRLHFLENSWSQGERVVKDGQILSEAASIKALKREREMLCKQMLKTFTASERNELFQEWGIGLNTKQRRVQLCNKLWKDTKDMEHLRRSASLVAKLVGIIEPNAASKEMFGLSFAPQPMNNLRSYTWSPRMPFII